MRGIRKVALLSVSLLVVSAGAIAGNIPAISQSYPHVNKVFIELLTTLPSLFIILTVLISPKIAKKIGYKLTVQLGILLVLIAGITPVISTSFLVLFFSRIVFGIGVGMFNPLLYTIAAYFYKGSELATVIGLQSAFEGIGGMLTTFLIGQLLTVSWHFSFWAYLLALPIFLIFSRFVPNVTILAQPDSSKEKNLSSESSKPLLFWYSFLLFLTVTVYMSVAVKVTSLLITKGIGDATAGSNLLALVGLGAMIAGICFGKTMKLLKQFTVPIAFVVLGCSMILFAITPNLLVASISAILCGLSFRTFIPYLFNEMNQNNSNKEKNTAILLIVFNFGSAFTPISLAFFHSLIPFLDQEGLFLVEGLVMFFLAIFFFLYNRKLNYRKKEISSSQ